MKIALRFRPATPDDIPACVILRGRTRENAVPAERLASMGITVRSWQEDVRSGSLPGYVCTDAGSLCGYCLLDLMVAHLGDEGLEYFPPGRAPSADATPR